MSDLHRMPSREQQEAKALALRMLQQARGDDQNPNVLPAEPEPFTDSVENAPITYPAPAFWRLVWQSFKRMSRLTASRGDAE